MDIVDAIKGCEKVLFCSDPVSELRAIIAIHRARYGYAAGGCRMWAYPTWEIGLIDILKLAKARTDQSVLYGLPFGGGASLIWGDPNKDKTKIKLTSFANHVALLGGAYYAAQDIGIDLSDMIEMRQVTPYITGVPSEEDEGNDVAQATAYGVFCGMRACLDTVFGGGDTFLGRKVAIQGLGEVGYALGVMLHKAGARLFVSDSEPQRIAAASRAFGADPLLGHEIYRVDCDIFAPCGTGGVLNQRTIPKLSCHIVAGAAGNQLDDPKSAYSLAERGILYAPDFVVNAGGAIQIANERMAYIQGRAYPKIEDIYEKLQSVFSLAKERSQPPAEVASQIVEEMLIGKGDA